MSNLPQPPRGASREVDLQNITERTLVEVPRGRDGKEVLRLSFTTATTPDGKDVAWHSLRVFWRDDSGEWRPGKAGVTLRGRELKPITEALIIAASGGVPPPRTIVTPPQQREPLPHEVYDRRAGRPPR